jgi:hypothetical protein
MATEAIEKGADTMTARILSILFFGTLFWFSFDFIFYSGLFVNYIEANGIPVFFNQFFADSQLWWLWIIGIVLYGSVFMVRNKTKEKALFYLLSILLAGIPWIPSFGEQIGTALFSKPHASYRLGKMVVEDATILYESRGYDYVKVPGKPMTLRYPQKNRIR